MPSEPPMGRRLLMAGGLVLTLALSLLLLGYVGWGEARRTYPRFELERLGAQGEIVSNSMDSFLLAGLPLEQFPGFTTVTQPLLDSDVTVVEIAITDPTGRTVFRNARGGEQTPTVLSGTFDPVSFKQSSTHYRVTEDSRHYRVTIELRNKFESVGNLHLVMSKDVIDQAITEKAAPVVGVGVAALLLFGLYALYATRVLPGRSAGSRTGTRALELMYTAAFFATAVVVVLSLVGIYADGIKGKTRSLTDSLSQRLNAPLELGLDLSDFDGIEATLADYRRLNPDLSFVAVEVNGRVVIHTDPAQVGAAWKPQSGQYEYQVALAEKQASAAPGSAQAETTSVHLGIPQSVIYEQLFRSVKNFVVVFVGAGLLAMLSLNFVTSLSGNVHGERRDETEAEPPGLRLLRPFYFLTVFVEGLSVSFLPQYLKGLNGGGGGSVSLFFTIYFVAFVLALIPAGRFAERGGGKSVLWMGALVVTISSVLMAMVESYTAMYGVRALAGMGQGMLSIGVQSYILRAARSNQRTRGAAIIVFGYNGGMISGAAIGALLVTYMGAQSVFVIGAIVGGLLVGYGLKLIPAVTGRAVESARQAQTSFKGTLSRAVKDWNFVKTTLLIGIPAKATVTGITVFALPLVLSRREFAQEDIGQIIMLYSAGVLISSTYVSRLVDRLGKTGVILFIGAIVSGLAMTCIGLIGWGPVADLRFGVVACLIAGMSALGLAHGLINAPIMTHISNTPSADVVGSTSVTSVYRFVERIGHMAGPVLVGQLLASSGQDPIVISALGVVLIVFGLAFAIGPVARGGGPRTAEARS